MLATALSATFALKDIIILLDNDCGIIVAETPVKSEKVVLDVVCGDDNSTLTICKALNKATVPLEEGSVNVTSDPVAGAAKVTDPFVAPLIFNGILNHCPNTTRWNRY